MSFFIAFFPFDFECAKVQQFLVMAIALGNFFATKKTIRYLSTLYI
jgi:hypothetical protein